MSIQVHNSVVLCGFLLGALSQVALAQIPTACADRRSLEDMTCCPATVDGVCGQDAGRGLCVATNFTGHSTETTDVRVNWPHYYTRICKCSGNFGGYDCSRCTYGYYGPDCGTKAVLPRKPVRDFTDQEWEDFIDIIRQTKTYDSGYKAVLEERQPGTADLLMSNVSLFDLMIWMHHFAAKDAFDTLSPDFLDFAHVGPAFFTWHRWYHVFFENEVQAMLQAMGRDDYHKFRFPYWDWRGEIQRSYGLPSEELFSFNRFGETRNISEHPVVFGDIVADNWATVCLNTFTVLCDPNMKTGPLQRCPFTGNPILCHSSNPGWPTMQQVNDILEVKYYETPPFNASGSNSFRPDADFYVTPIGSEECREDDYCVCLPVGVECEDPSAIRLIIGIHTMAHFLLGPGSTDFSVPPEKIGSFGDIAASPNDPVFVLHHLMLDCILEEWMERHPGSGYPVHPDIRDGHRKDDYIRTYFPLITNGEVFESTQEFGYYCQLPDLDTTEPTPPCPLEPTFSFIISGSSVDVCVETKEAAAIKLILRDAGYKRYVKHMIGSSGCSTFNGLPAGVHRVKAITRKCVSGGGEGYISDVLYFSTK